MKMGLMTQAEVNTGYGIYGPKTTAAAAKLSGIKTQMESDIVKEANANKILNPVAEGATGPTIKYNTYADALAGAGGNVTDMTNQYGQPFSVADQQAALSAAEAAGGPAFEQEKQKEQQDAAATLASQQQQYETYQRESGVNFAKDKTAQDQSAAEHGVLFSGGRQQKLQNLQSAYQTDQASKRNTLGTNIGNVARDYQYKYGNQAAQGLSQYYQAGGNTYNPNGGAGSQGLSSVYNPAASNFYGTEVKKQKVGANQYAAGLLWNKGNKIVPGGYKNQF